MFYNAVRRIELGNTLQDGYYIVGLTTAKVSYNEQEESVSIASLSPFRIKDNTLYSMNMKTGDENPPTVSEDGFVVYIGAITPITKEQYEENAEEHKEYLALKQKLDALYKKRIARYEEVTKKA